MVAPLETNSGGLAKDMTLRDWYIGQALVGLLTGQYRENGRYNLADLPDEACRIANALIERERGK